MPRKPSSNALRPFIGGWPQTRNTTSSDIKRRMVSTSPAAVARCHCAIRYRIVCSSVFMEPPFLRATKKHKKHKEFPLMWFLCFFVADPPATNQSRCTFVYDYGYEPNTSRDG